MKRCLMMMLLIVLLMPTIYATPQVKEPTIAELYSTIDPSLYYPGSVVKEFAERIFQEADRYAAHAYQQGIMQGAAMAARPLQARIEGLEAWQDEAKDKLLDGAVKTILFTLGGIAVGITIGVIVW